MKEFWSNVVAFFAIFGEMLRQMYICLTTDSLDYERKQDLMFYEEASEPILEDEVLDK
jgi:hypothetical protein